MESPRHPHTHTQTHTHKCAHPQKHTHAHTDTHTKHKTCSVSFQSFLCGPTIQGVWGGGAVFCQLYGNPIKPLLFHHLWVPCPPVHRSFGWPAIPAGQAASGVSLSRYLQGSGTPTAESFISFGLRPNYMKSELLRSIFFWVYFFLRLSLTAVMALW